MKNLKKFLSLGLAAVMTMSLAACGDSTATTTTPSGSGTSTESSSSDNTVTDTPVASGTNDVIDIGTWWVQYYDSSNAIEDAPDWNSNQDAEGDSESTLETKAFNRNICQLKFDNVTTIEEKYGVEFYWRNLTYTGVQESINVSILAGSPDCDIYLTDAGMAIPAQMNGLALDLRDVLPADHDLFTDQKIMQFCDLGDGKVCIIQRVEAQHQVEATYPLAFNMQMLEDNNLEDPRTLWERGEWTWDKFIEYCQVLTQDTDGDGQIDQYGFCGYEYETFENLMMSNGGNIAQGSTQTLDSAPVGEALQMMSDMFNVYNVCYPYDFEGNASDSMRNQYTQGNIGFFPIACWIASGNNDYDYGNTTGTTLPFDTAYVRWPVGPSGDAATNAGKNDIPAECYIIPAGVQEPEKVVNVLYDMWNWGGDEETTASMRDDEKALNWWYGSTARTEELQVANFNVMKDCGAHTTFDLWNSLGVSYDFQSLIKGEVTPAQFQETYKQQVQDGLDAYFN